LVRFASLLVSTIARSQKSFPGPRGSAQLKESAWLAYQEATRSQAAADAAREETDRVRADAEKTLAAFRADLRARAERAERETDAYRAELAQLRARRPHAHGGRVLAAPQDGGNLFYVNWLRPRPFNSRHTAIVVLYGQIQAKIIGCTSRQEPPRTRSRWPSAALRAKWCRPSWRLRGCADEESPDASGTSLARSAPVRAKGMDATVRKGPGPA